MTLNLPMNVKPIAAVAALAWTAITIGTAVTPTPAAAAEGAYYQVELTAPAAKASAVAGGMVWKCAETSCTSAKGTSRPAIVCARLVKQVGQVSAFSAGGKALAAEELARCNGK